MFMFMFYLFVWLVVSYGYCVYLLCFVFCWFLFVWLVLNCYCLLFDWFDYGCC